MAIVQLKKPPTISGAPTKLSATVNHTYLYPERCPNKCFSHSLNEEFAFLRVITNAIATLFALQQIKGASR